VGAGTATLGPPFVPGRRSFSHPERMPSPSGLSERRFPKPSFSTGLPQGSSNPGAAIPKENPESPEFWPVAKPRARHVRVATAVRKLYLPNVIPLYTEKGKGFVKCILRAITISFEDKYNFPNYLV